MSVCVCVRVRVHAYVRVCAHISGSVFRTPVCVLLWSESSRLWGSFVALDTSRDDTVSLVAMEKKQGYTLAQWHRVHGILHENPSVLGI